MNRTYFEKRSDLISSAVVGSHMLLVVSPVYIAAALGPGWSLMACWLIFGLGMNSVLNLMHECAHFHVFKTRAWSDRLGGYVIGPLVFANFETYRRRHWDHHKFIGVEGETKDTYLIGVRRWNLVRLFARCVLMVEGASKFFKQTRSVTGSEPRGRGWLLNIAVFQAIFASSLVATAGIFNSAHGWRAALISAAVAYVVVYLYGLMSLTVFAASLRAIAEHQQYDDGAATEGYAALRNFSCNPVSRSLMGAYGFGEHYTHHRVPGIPYYRLRAATTEMAKTDQTLRPEKDYFRVLAEIIGR